MQSIRKVDRPYIYIRLEGFTKEQVAGLQDFLEKNDHGSRAPRKAARKASGAFATIQFIASHPLVIEYSKVVGAYIAGKFSDEVYSLLKRWFQRHKRKPEQAIVIYGPDGGVVKRIKTRRKK
jgi:hypothetical protein